MDVPAADSGAPRQRSRRPHGALTGRETDRVSRELRKLRARWRTASLASGWRFPSDWALPEVDVVCSAAVRGTDTEPALTRLARARASAGAGLTEVLGDVAALHAVLEDFTGSGDGWVYADIDALPARMLRVTAVAWADVAMDQLANIEVSDPMTGLPTDAYLRTRLGELYRRTTASGQRVTDEYTLLAVTLDLSTVSGWHRVTGMILLAEALREVLDGGESMATLGPSTVVAVLPRDGHITTKAMCLRRALHDHLSVDEQLDGMRSPRIRLIRLPETHEAACRLLQGLARA